MTKQRTILTALWCWIACTLYAQHQLVFTPQWAAQAQFAGFYVAEAKGYYNEAGLQVSFQHPLLSNPCINKLKDGKSQIITLHLMSAIRYINEGMQLVNVMQVLQNNSQMLISHKPLKSIHDLKGKHVGCWRAGFFELPKFIDEQLNLDIHWVPIVSHVNLYISKAIDATMAQSYNELFQLKLAGLQFQDSQLIYLSDIGYNVPEDGVYVTADYYRQHKADIDKFVSASRKGWEWAAQHPEEALDIVMKACKKYGTNTNRTTQRWMLNQILELMKDKKTGKRTYRLSPEDLKLANRFFAGSGQKKQPVTYQQITQP